MFYLTLPSNSSMNYCPNNTLTHYTTKLPKITDLDGAWEIRLAEIQYPHSWNSVKNNEAWLKVHFYRESELQKQLVLLPDGYSSSAKRIIKAIDGKKQGRYGHGRTPRTTSYKRTCQAKKDQTSAD